MPNQMSDADLRNTFRDIDIAIQKVRSEVPVPLAKASTLSTLCCSICVSTASSIWPESSIIQTNPDAANRVALFYQQGVEVLGKEGFTQQMIKAARNPHVFEVVKTLGGLDSGGGADQPPPKSTK